MKLRAIFAVAVVLLVAGCITVNKSVLNRSHAMQPVPKEEVQVYFSGDSLPQHERIAILTAKGDWSSTDESQMIDKLRQEAGKLGANAIVINDMKDPKTVSVVAQVLFGTAADRKGVALAIYAPSLLKGK